MIRTRIMELRRRRGLMWALVIVFMGLPTIFLTVRLIMHAVNPKVYSPAGGYQIFNNLVTAVLFILGFIVAATLGSFAGSVDLTEGVFRHLVVTGRSRLALYFARIPAGLAILVPVVAAGFTIVCPVVLLRRPTQDELRRAHRSQRPDAYRVCPVRRQSLCRSCVLAAREEPPDQRALRAERHRHEP